MDKMSEIENKVALSKRFFSKEQVVKTLEGLSKQEPKISEDGLNLLIDFREEKNDDFISEFSNRLIQYAFRDVSEENTKSTRESLLNNLNEIESKSKEDPLRC